MKVNRGRVVAPDCAAARRRPTDAHAQRHATMDDDQDAYEEALHLAEVVETFRKYARLAMNELQRHANHFKALPDKYRRLLPDVPRYHKEGLDRVVLNQKFIDVIVNASASAFQSNAAAVDPGKVVAVTPANFEKIKSTLRQFVREWSADGADERGQSYGRLLQTLCDLFPADKCDRGQIRVLTPGSGLGRLTWEVARLGFMSEGNEFSYFMLIGSHFMLNCYPADRPALDLYPYVSQTTNVVSQADRLRRFQVPDVHPASTPISGSMSMVAGDFLEVYTDDVDGFDAIVTCFFIDTAHNIVQYIETIARILKPGGYWINLGPLLYHFSDTNELSIELSYEEVKALLPTFGLTMIDETLPVDCFYVGNARSMMQFLYKCAFFTCQKQSPMH
ncbi:Carnosine N-methyltransferase [Plasmodiophora brassicae]